MKRKGLTTMALGVIALIAVITIFAIPDTRGLVLSIAPMHCDLSPFNENCYCDEGYQKMSLTWIGDIKKNVCEAVYTSDPEMEAVQDAKTALLMAFPDCDTIACEPEMVEGRITGPVATHGVTLDVDEYRVECYSYSPINPLPDIWWSVTIRTDTGELYIPFPQLAPFCTSLDGTIYR